MSDAGRKNVIDLGRVRTVLEEVNALVEELDGLRLDERDANDSQGGSKLRHIKARRSQALNLLASRFELAAALTRVEYFYARGEPDPTQPRRND